MVRLVDVLPTVMEIVQGTSVNRPIEFEGYSFLPLMRDDSAKFQVKYSFAQRRPADQGREGYWVQGDVYSLQSDNSKYILFSDTEDEFYDLNDDPKELNNLINTTSKEADMMRNQLASEVQRMLRRNPTSAVKPDNKEHLEELRSLGYVQ
jgi:arylsulfatase A-like enzyme